MKFTVDKHEKYVTFKLEETNLNSLIAPQLKSELVLLNSHGVKNIILDLTSVKNSDSSGLSSILSGHRLCKGCEGSFVVCGSSEHLTRLLEITKLDSVLALVPSEEEAIDIIFMEEIERELNREAEK